MFEEIRVQSSAILIARLRATPGATGGAARNLTTD
jgi:hypothetical protein